MSYRTYIHVERLGREEVEGILDGKCYVFPKLDGTNACVWADNDGNIHCGSRNREISVSKDNAGFAQYVLSANDEIGIIRNWCIDHPNMVVFGEWLCPTKLGKNYINKKKFYVFDVLNKNEYNTEDDIQAHYGYVHYEVYSKWFEDYPYVIEPFAVIDNPTVEQLNEIAENNHYNLPDNIIGEGIVIKNYVFRNKFNHYEVAKIVREEFKSTKKEKTVIPPGEYELMFLEQCVTPVLIQKCKDKAVVACGSEKMNNKLIGMTMSLVWKDAVEEELYTFINKNKFAVIDFGSLNKQVNAKVRDFFGL